MGNELRLQNIIKKLKQDDTRWDAILDLKMISDIKLVPYLLKALDDKDWIVRWCIAEKLGDLGDKKAIPVLIKYLGDPDPHVRRNVMKSLYKLGPDGIPILVKEFRNQDIVVRKGVYSVLLSFGPQIASFLGKQIGDKDWIVENHIVHALWLLSPSTIEDILISLLSKKNVQKNVLIILGSFKSIKIIPHLLNLYPIHSLRRIIIRSLLSLPTKLLFTELCHYYLDKDKHLAKQAALIMISIGAPFLKYLINSLSQDSNHNNKLLFLISKIGPQPIMREIHLRAKQDISFAKQTRDLRRKFPSIS